VEGGGAGAGGFCANATGTRSPIASASSTKMRMRGFTDLFLGRERLSNKFSTQVSSSQGFRSEQRPLAGFRGCSVHFGWAILADSRRFGNSRLHERLYFKTIANKRRGAQFGICIISAWLTRLRTSKAILHMSGKPTNQMG